MVEKKRPKQEEFVSALVPDPDAVPDTRLLIGFIGNSSKDGHLRLYLTPELTEYFDIREADVLRTQPLQPGEKALSGTAVWIKRDCEVQHTRSTTVDVQAGFLQGNIARTFLPGATTSGIFGGGAGKVGIKSIPPIASVCFGCVTDNCPIATAGGSTCEYACTHICTLSTGCRTQFLCF